MKTELDEAVKAFRDAIERIEEAYGVDVNVYRSHMLAKGEKPETRLEVHYRLSGGAAHV